MTEKEADQSVITEMARWASIHRVNTTASAETPASTFDRAEVDDDENEIIARGLWATTIPYEPGRNPYRTKKTRSSTVIAYSYTTFWYPKTYSVTWKYTSATTPSALASSCQAEGGHFGRGSRAGSSQAAEDPWAGQDPYI